MGQLIVRFSLHVDLGVESGQGPSDWLLGQTLTCRTRVVEFMKGSLDAFVARWGDFEWRKRQLLHRAKRWRRHTHDRQDGATAGLFRGFLDNIECAFSGRHGGGNYGGYDYPRYASAFPFSDGAVAIATYYASLLFPPDKTSDIPDVWNPDKYDKATWRRAALHQFRHDRRTRVTRRTRRHPRTN